MHYFQFLLIFRLNQTWLCLPPYAQAIKGRKSRGQTHMACLRDSLCILYSECIILRMRDTPANYTMPCPSIASTTFSNPAILAPAT